MNGSPLSASPCLAVGDAVCTMCIEGPWLETIADWDEQLVYVYVEAI